MRPRSEEEVAFMARPIRSVTRPIRQAPPAVCETPDCGTKLSIYRARDRGSWATKCRGCEDREIRAAYRPPPEPPVSGSTREFQRLAVKVMAEYGYELSPTKVGGGGGGQGHLAFVDAAGHRFVAPRTPRNPDTALGALKKRVERITRQRVRMETPRGEEMAMARRAMDPADVDLHYHRFADWLCELHGIGKTEGKQLWVSMAAEIRAWIAAEHPPGITEEAFVQAVRLRQKRDNPRIVIVESRRGGAPSLYEIRGRKFGQVVEEPKTLELVPDEETFDGGPAEGELQRAQQFQQVEQPAEAEEHPLFTESVQPAAVTGDLVTQITSLVERAARADEAETKTELALEMLENARVRLADLCTLCSEMQDQVSRAIDELR